MIFVYIIIMAAVTYLVRMLPLALIRKKIRSRFILGVLAYLPYTVLAALTFPAVFSATSSPTASAAGCAAACALAFFKVPMVLVALAASAVAFIFLVI
ncbi:MAG: AzlD domain-containing protein [Clostridia bacterium]|nr:AzlD domain-containing protein [Clostridia bacterium]